MIRQSALGKTKIEQLRKLAIHIKAGEISIAGYVKAKIYGSLGCSSGKRMKIENRIFFRDEAEARDAGYRPCGNCMKHAYKKWKGQNINSLRK